MVEAQTTTTAGISTPIVHSARWSGTSVVLPADGFFAELSALADEGDRFVTAAPRRLDVMGGVSELYGSMSVQTPLDDPVYASAARRTDRSIVIAEASRPEANGHTPLILPIASLYRSDWRAVEAAEARLSLVGGRSESVRAALACLVEVLRARSGTPPESGISLLVTTPRVSGKDPDHLASLSAAVVTALNAALNLSLDEPTARAIGHRVLEEWLQVRACPSELACLLSGQPGVLTHCQGNPTGQVVPFSLSERLALYGVDTGFISNDVAERLDHMHATSLIGAFLVEQILRHQGRACPSTHGVYSQVSLADFVAAIKDRLPTKIKGREFLECQGERFESAHAIAPDKVYKVRSRAEHHVYMHSRTKQFVSALGRADRTNDDQALMEAGEVMYSSNWSYTQRCGLGCVEADHLVQLVRARGAEDDLYGAKATGYGCGGIVVVLAKKSDRSLAALSTVVEEYQRHTGRAARLVSGGRPGAMAAGVRVM